MCFHPALTAVAHVRRGQTGLLYVIVSYLMELTWRQRIDGVLLAHHALSAVGILIMAGELAWLLVDVGDIHFTLLLFGVLEQPMFVALLLHRLAPHTDAARRRVLRAWTFACWFWVASKALAAVLSLSFYVGRAHLMEPWMKLAVGGSAAGIVVIQARAGAIFFGIRCSVQRELAKAAAATSPTGQEQQDQQGQQGQQEQQEQQANGHQANGDASPSTPSSRSDTNNELLHQHSSGSSGVDGAPPKGCVDGGASQELLSRPVVAE